MNMKRDFRSKETSWLSFNERVLQESLDPKVPLYERIKFLGIYSSNLDEFFRVRVATLKRLISIGDNWKKFQIPDPNETFRKVTKIVSEQAKVYNEAFNKVKIDLEKEGIKIIDDTEVPNNLKSYLNDYFKKEVSSHIFPIILKSYTKLPNLKDLPMYIAVKASKKNGSRRPLNALIEIPGNLPRFIPLPKKDKKQLVIFLDDIIRFKLDEIFAKFPYDSFESYAIKFTRDSELEMDDDFTESFYEKLSGSLKAREQGLPVRATFDADFPKPFLNLLIKKIGLDRSNSLFPGAKYHNRRDLLSFPKFNNIKDLTYETSPPIVIKSIKKEKGSIFPAIRKKDILLHIPYNSFNYLINLLQEASMDPLVKKIFITQYRLAKNSCIAKAIQAASSNGKEVFVLVEPQARFDEKANIKWASFYKDSGASVQLGIKGLKVHSKMVLITRRESGKDKFYSVLGTGNFNEDSAKTFSDHLLMTYNQEIGADVLKIFKFFKKVYHPPKLNHVILSPFSMRNFILEKIEREINNHKGGKPACISIKVNNFSDPKINYYLKKATSEGVPIKLIIRSMFSMIIDKDNPIDAISIVDKYLEHSRLLIFENGGDKEVFLSSADFLSRNFDTRIETAFPIYDKSLKGQLVKYFDIQWNDNVKARVLDYDLSNKYKKENEVNKPIRSQFEIEDFLKNL